MQALIPKPGKSGAHLMKDSVPVFHSEGDPSGTRMFEPVWFLIIRQELYFITAWFAPAGTVAMSWAVLGDASGICKASIAAQRGARSRKVLAMMMNTRCPLGAGRYKFSYSLIYSARRSAA